MKKSLFTIALIGLVIVGCRKTKPTGVLAENAMVVSARDEASSIGTEVMKNGGNAFDAAVAVNFALAVAYPYAGNIGGGGFMVYRTNDGAIGGLDYREKAPLASSRDMYLDQDGNPDLSKSQLGILASGVPGTVDGMIQIHQKFGKTKWAELLQPAIDLAENGVIITKKQAGKLNAKRDLFIQANTDSTAIPFVKKLLWKEGDTLIQPAIAETLKRIQENGRAGFYEGKTAKLIVEEMQKQKGLITQKDLNKYQSVWRDPVTFDYKELTVHSMSPPSSGGICLAQIMKSIEPYDVGKLKHNSEKSIQIITEAERRAYADRSHWLGDPDFFNIPMDSLISEPYLSKRMSNFDWEKATLSADVSHGEVTGYESNETTHFSIVDQDGNAVSITTTINGAYGSKVVVGGAGFLLNNEMDDFSAKPGVPNMFGLIGAEANSIAPEKRMLSSMTPTIVEKEGKLYMVVGTPGGSTIITSVLQTILNVYEYKLGMQEAVDAPRFHHQWLPDKVMLEPNGFSTELIQALTQKGYTIEEGESVILGKVDAILIHQNGMIEGGADRRGDDSSVGF